MWKCISELRVWVKQWIMVWLQKDACTQETCSFIPWHRVTVLHVKFSKRFLFNGRGGRGSRQLCLPVVWINARRLGLLCLHLRPHRSQFQPCARIGGGTTQEMQRHAGAAAGFVNSRSSSATVFARSADDFLALLRNPPPQWPWFSKRCIFFIKLFFKAMRWVLISLYKHDKNKK